MSKAEYDKLSAKEKRAYHQNEKFPSLKTEADPNWVMGKETAEFGGANLSNMETENKKTVAAGDAVRKRLVDKYLRENKKR